MENKAGCGYCDKIVIHSYPHSRSGIHAQVHFKRGGRIVMRIIMIGVPAVLSYMQRQPFCEGIPYRVINHKEA